MPRLPDRDPKVWSGIQLPSDRKFFDKSDVKDIAQKTGKSLDREIEVPMPTSDGTLAPTRGPAIEFLTHRLNRLAQFYVMKQSEARMPTPKQYQATIKSIESNIAGLIASLGMSVKIADGASPEINIPYGVRRAIESHIQDFALADAQPEIASAGPRAGAVKFDVQSGALNRVLAGLHVLSRAVKAAGNKAENSDWSSGDPDNLIIERLADLYETAFGDDATRRTNHEDGVPYGPFLDFAEAVCDRIDRVIEEARRDGEEAILAPPMNLSHDAIASRLRRLQAQAKARR